MKIRNKEYTCTFETVVDLIGLKWKPLIIWYLGTNGAKRFNELKKLIPQAT
jgi:DNA-binding HxlR family transcriptional regulator